MRRIFLQDPIASMMLRRRAAAGLIGLILITGALPAQSKLKLLPFWDASDESSTSRIDHSAWQEILDTYLRSHGSGINRFDYAALKANAGDTAKLAGYLSYLQEIDPRTYSRREQKAYWFNFYNSLTVKVVADAYPVDSIRKISNSMLGGLIPVGPWGDVRARVCGQDLTLDNIEHGILRPIYRDPRIHYGVNCASLGCPNLLETAFTAANAETSAGWRRPRLREPFPGRRLRRRRFPRHLQHLHLVFGGLRRHRGERARTPGAVCGC